MKRIGITTTVPSEAIWASGAIPVDLNNLFISSERRDDFIQFAERDGYPRNVCGWIKGIYGALNFEPDIKTFIAVTQGDCSNTHALMETLQLKGIRTIPFAYPYDRNPDALAREIIHLTAELNTTMDAAEKIRKKLVPVRTLLDRLDEMTWKDNRVTGYENHINLVASSDFNGDINTFSNKLSDFLDLAEKRNPFEKSIRLAYIGVPPVLDDIYQTVEHFGGRFVFNEVQRQFSFPKRTGKLVDNYLEYTYPYDIFHRLDYIIPELKRRNIHGVIHYVQSFCHRGIEDLIVRKKVPLPILTIEGDSPGKVDERLKIRLQAFIEMLDGKA
ncbi:2-hydroxyacyl-CoA dehydratase family protein [Candidatus Latescibacterota bacterium]